MKNEVIDKIGVLSATAFGLVAALAWNSAIQAIFKAIFGQADNIGPMLVYALIVTVIAVVAAILIGRATTKAKEIKIQKNIKILKQK